MLSQALPHIPYLIKHTCSCVVFVVRAFGLHLHSDQCQIKNYSIYTYIYIYIYIKYGVYDIIYAHIHIWRCQVICWSFLFCNAFVRGGGVVRKGRCIGNTIWTMFFKHVKHSRAEFLCIFAPLAPFRMHFYMYQPLRIRFASVSVRLRPSVRIRTFWFVVEVRTCRALPIKPCHTLSKCAMPCRAKAFTIKTLRVVPVPNVTKQNVSSNSTYSPNMCHHDSHVVLVWLLGVRVTCWTTIFEVCLNDTRPIGSTHTLHLDTKMMSSSFSPLWRRQFQYGEPIVKEKTNIRNTYLGNKKLVPGYLNDRSCESSGRHAYAAPTHILGWIHADLI